MNPHISGDFQICISLIFKCTNTTGGTGKVNVFTLYLYQTIQQIEKERNNGFAMWV